MLGVGALAEDTLGPRNEKVRMQHSHNFGSSLDNLRKTSSIRRVKYTDRGFIPIVRRDTICYLCVSFCLIRKCRHILCLASRLPMQQTAGEELVTVTLGSRANTIILYCLPFSSLVTLKHIPTHQLVPIRQLSIVPLSLIETD